jgi:hypothetical protein
MVKSNNDNELINSNEHNEYDKYDEYDEYDDTDIDTDTDTDTDTDSLSKFILKFIEKRFTKYHFTRMQNYNKNSGFANYEDFLEHNKKIINNLDDVNEGESAGLDIFTLYNMVENMTEKKIIVTDAENFVEVPLSTFYFNKDNKLVLMMPR